MQSRRLGCSEANGLILHYDVKESRMTVDFDLLMKMQPSRKRRTDGEVFVVQPAEGTFYFGKVIKTKIPAEDPMVNGWHLVYIFNQASNETNIPNYLNPHQLLIPPCIVNNQGWLKGYFQTVGYQEITDEERKVDFGFWDILSKTYVNEEGMPLNCQPKFFGDFGLGSYGLVAYEISKALSI